MSSYDIYSFGGTLNEMRERLEEVLNICFELHESLGYGGEYWLYRESATGPLWTTIRIFGNRDDEGEPIEDDLSCHMHLVTIEGHNIDMWRAKVAQLKELEWVKRVRVGR